MLLLACATPFQRVGPTDHSIAEETLMKSTTTDWLDRVFSARGFFLRSFFYLLPALLALCSPAWGQVTYDWDNTNGVSDPFYQDAGN